MCNGLIVSTSLQGPFASQWFQMLAFIAILFVFCQSLVLVLLLAFLFFFRYDTNHRKKKGEY